MSIKKLTQKEKEMIVDFAKDKDIDSLVDDMGCIAFLRKEHKCATSKSCSECMLIEAEKHFKAKGKI